MSHVTVPAGDYYALLDAVRGIQDSDQSAITPLSIATQFIGTREVLGHLDNPQIMAMLHLDHTWPQNDETPWCSAFVNYVAWIARMQRTRSLMARSWLSLMRAVHIDDARQGFDVVILKRGGADQPGPESLKASGHVGFYLSHDEHFVTIVGGNQGNRVSAARYPLKRVLGVRRLERAA